MRPREGKRFARTFVGISLAFGLCLANPMSVSGQTDVRRLALVITNDGAGPDVASGGAAMSQRLSGLGFDVRSAPNGGERDVGRESGTIEGRIDASTLVVIYYAGFSVRANNTDYLLPAGAAPVSVSDLAGQGFDLTALVRRLRDKGALVVVILDACPRSPVIRTLGGVCAGDPAGRERDVYLVSAGASLPTGDLTARVGAILKGGRSVADIFDDIQAQFGATAVIQTPSRTLPRANEAQFGRAGPPASVAAATAPVPYTLAFEQAAAQPASPEQQAAGGGALDGAFAQLIEAVDTAEAGDIEAARRALDGFRERYDRLTLGASNTADVRVGYGQLAYVVGQYDVAVREFDTARANGLGGSLKLDVLQGTAYLRMGRLQEAVAMLERAREGYEGRLSEEGYIEKLSRVRIRLGEAYRRLGRNAEARVELESALRDFPRADNAGASMQLALLALAEGSWSKAETFAIRAIEYRESTRSQAGLAEAYVALGRAKYNIYPTDEAQAWRYVEMARRTEPGSPDATQFAASLPPQQLSPSFESMRPRLYNFDTTIESQVRSCYETPIERDAYLVQVVGGEMGRIADYVRQVNAYIGRLSNLDVEYQKRGYDFHDLIITEIALWTDRSNSAKHRSDTLDEWYKYVSPKLRICRSETPGAIPTPPGYRPNIPVATAAPPPRTASLPPPAPFRPVATPPVYTSPLSPPPAAPVKVAAAPVLTAPPPLLTAPTPAVTAPPPAAKPASPPPPSRSTPSPQWAEPPSPSATRPPAQATVPPAAAPAPTRLTAAPVQTVAAPPTTPPPAATAPQRATPPPPAASTPARTGPPAPKPAPTTPPPALTAAATTPQSAVASPPASAPPPAAPTRLALATPPPMSPITPPPTAAPAKPGPARGAAGKPGRGETPPPAPAKPAPTTAQKEIEAGRALTAKGDLPAARAAFDRAVALEANNPDALDGRGYVLLLIDEDADAQRDIVRALELRPNFAEARYHLGLLYKKLGVLTAAITQFDNAISLDPRFARAFLAKGQALEAQTRLPDAIANYELALKIEPSNSGALEARGRAFFQLGDYEKARQDFRRAIELNAFSTDLLYSRGRAELALKLFDDAVATFEELALRRSDYATQCSRGMAYLERGGLMRDKKDKSDFRKAYDSFSAALAFKPKDTEATNRQTYAFSQSGNSAIGMAGKVVLSIGSARKPSVATLDPTKACSGA